MRDIPDTRTTTCTRCTFDRDIDPVLGLCASCIQLERQMQDAKARDASVLSQCGIAWFDPRRIVAEVTHESIVRVGVIHKRRS